MIINEAGWALAAGSTDRLGPSLNKVWKVTPKADDLDTAFQAYIRITNKAGTSVTYELPGSNDTTDVNSHASTEIWMLTGDYITRWASLNHVEIYEYNGFNQQATLSSGDLPDYVEFTAQPTREPDKKRLRSKYLRGVR